MAAAVRISRRFATLLINLNTINEPEVGLQKLVVSPTARESKRTAHGRKATEGPHAALMAPTKPRRKSMDNQGEKTWKSEN